MSDTRERILTLLLDIAPEAADQAIPPDADLREVLDIDSMDQLNFLIAVAESFGIDIPESDYGGLVSLDAVTSYVERHRPG